MKKDVFNPIIFLSALGPGGLAVSFFMYLMFIIPRNSGKFPIPNFDILKGEFLKGNLFFQIVIILASFGIIYFAIKHFKIFYTLLKEYLQFKKTQEYNNFVNGKNEISLIALPLTLAMSINVIFILGAVFVPGLWNIVEYLFPLALIGFGVVGFLALKIFMHYFSKILQKKGGVDILNNNSLNQLISVMTFVMVGVGFAASVAMSHTKLTIFFGLVGSISFITIALILLIVKLILGLRAIFEHGLDKSSSPSVWIIIPILTLIGITIIRNSHGLHSFGLNSSNAFYLVLTITIFAIQLFFGILGYNIMKENNYFKDYIGGNEKNPSSYSLICPGVALVVFGFFFIHLGLVKAEIIDKYSIAYYLVLLPFIFLQIKTIIVMFKLNKKFFKT